jgi:protocatechuate 3,4-dioxygenase beta subunit
MVLARLLFASFFLFVFAGTLLAQDRLKVTGRVLDANGAVVTGGNVSLNRNDVRFSRQVVTDAGGNFEFTDLVEGSYQISATAKNFGT